MGARQLAIKNVLTQRPLHADGPARVVDVVCRSSRSAFAEEETVDRCQLIFPRRGTFDVRMRGRTTSIDGNAVVVLSAGERYRVAHPHDCGDECTTISVDMEVPTSVVRMDPAHRLALENVRHARDAFDAQERALGIVAWARAARVIGSVHHREIEPLEHARTLLAGNAHSPLRLSALAMAVHLSPYHLARRFRAYTGTSMHQYRMNARLNEALTRLTDSNDALTTIALDSGFTSASHFSSEFRRRFGMAPSEMRRVGSIKTCW